MHPKNKDNPLSHPEQGQPSVPPWTRATLCLTLNKGNPLSHPEQRQPSVSPWTMATLCLTLNKGNPLSHPEQGQPSASPWTRATYCILCLTLGEVSAASWATEVLLVPVKIDSTDGRLQERVQTAHIAIHCFTWQEFIPLEYWSHNKSDISYLKTSRAFDVLIHSGKPNSVGIATLYRGTTSIELLASGTGVSALGQPRVVASTLPLLLGIHLEVVTVVDYS